MNLPTQSEFAAALRKLRSWLYVEEPARPMWHGGFEIRAETSEHGDCAYDKPGRIDLEHAEKVRAALSALWPTLRVYVGNTNETVYVSVGLPFEEK
jgi:hypothetical protein